jgi:hypothetical protein
MVNYQNGKIYKIWSPQTEMIYIGSTTRLLCQRLADHKSNLTKYNEGKTNYTSSFEIIIFDDAKIELIENFACNNKEELSGREGNLQREYRNICVNMRIEGRTSQEYYLDNKDYINKSNRERRLNNIEEYKERDREYYINHREERLEYRRLNYENNREKILEQQAQPYQCECGSTTTSNHKTRHFKSKKHQNYINSQSTSSLSNI